MCDDVSAAYLGTVADSNFKIEAVRLCGDEVSEAFPKIS